MNDRNRREHYRIEMDFKSHALNIGLLKRNYLNKKS